MLDATVPLPSHGANVFSMHTRPTSYSKQREGLSTVLLLSLWVLGIKGAIRCIYVRESIIPIYMNKYMYTDRCIYLIHTACINSSAITAESSSHKYSQLWYRPLTKISLQSFLIISNYQYYICYELNYTAVLWLRSIVPPTHCVSSVSINWVSVCGGRGERSRADYVRNVWRGFLSYWSYRVQKRLYHRQMNSTGESLVSPQSQLLRGWE